MLSPNSQCWVLIVNTQVNVDSWCISQQQQSMTIANVQIDASSWCASWR
jgi:hypothetical protein